MKSLQSIIILGVLLCLAACMKDKGTYTTTELNDVQISGIDTLYLVDQGKKVVIRPVLKFALDPNPDTANYSYKWIADRQIGYANAAKLIATGHDLDQVITGLNFGSYAMVYRVTDKKTGIFTDKYFTMAIGSPDYEGWMMLCDTEDGKSRLDMVSRRGSVDTAYKDILGVVGSAFKTDGKPAFLSTLIAVLGPAGGELAVFVATDSKAGILGRNNLEYLPTYEIGNYYSGTDRFTNYSGANLQSGFVGSLMYAQDKLYSIRQRTITGPVNKQDAGTTLFSPSPYIAMNPLIQGGSAIVFNKTTKTFLRYPMNTNSCLTLPNGTLFNFQVNMDLLYMEYAPFNGGEVFAILKNPSNQKVYLARFTTSGVQVYFDEIAVPGISNASHFAISPEFGYVFYDLDNIVYEYDYSVKKNTKMADYSGRKVTVLKFHPFLYTIVAANINKAFYGTLSRKLIVGSYDGKDASSSGKLDLYNVPAINAEIQLYKSYSGMGKITSVVYRER